MLRYTLRRLLLLIPLLSAAPAIIFLLLRLGTDDPVPDYLRLSNLPLTEKMVASTYELLGFNQLLAMQYPHWLWRVLHLDFGPSYATQRPVLDNLLHFLPAILLLAGAVLALILVTSLPLGIWVVRYHDHPPDYAIRLTAFLGVSTLNLWLAFLLVTLFSVHLQWLPAVGYGNWQHLILSAVSIASMSLATNARLLRASMLDAVSQRHVIRARLRGLSVCQAERRCILRNATLPVVIALGMHTGELIGDIMITESILAWPGVGRYAVPAIFNRDHPVIQCFTLMMVAMFVLANPAADALNAALDPRLCRHKEMNA